MARKRRNNASNIRRFRMRRLREAIAEYKRVGHLKGLLDPPDWSLVERVMIEEGVSGDPRDYVAIFQDQLVDGNGNKQFRLQDENGGPVRSEKRILTHKRYLVRHVSRQQAERFWKAGMRV